MKHSLQLTFSFILLFASNAVFGQRAWRVNAQVSAGANFTSFQAAIDSASNGDTLYVEPGNYGNVNLNKNLKIFGAGFDVNLYDSATAYISDTQFGNVSLFSGASGSVIQSFRCTGVSTNANQQIRNITIAKCLIDGTIILGNNSNLLLENISVNQCIVSQVFVSTQNNNGLNVKNIVFRNNIIAGVVNTSTSSQGTFTNTFENILFDRNILYVPNGQAVAPNGAIFSNNIIGWTSLPTSAGATFNNNIFTLAAPTGSGTSTFATNNIWGVPQGNIFEVLNWNTISINQIGAVTRFRLRTGSPAIGAASDGGNCGIFGGPNAMPVPPFASNPRVIFIESDGVSNTNTNQLRFRIKARSGE